MKAVYLKPLLCYLVFGVIASCNPIEKAPTSGSQTMSVVIAKELLHSSYVMRESLETLRPNFSSKGVARNSIDRQKATLCLAKIQAVDSILRIAIRDIAKMHDINNESIISTEDIQPVALQFEPVQSYMLGDANYAGVASDLRGHVLSMSKTIEGFTPYIFKLNQYPMINSVHNKGWRKELRNYNALLFYAHLHSLRLELETLRSRIITSLEDSK